MCTRLPTSLCTCYAAHARGITQPSHAHQAGIDFKMVNIDPEYRPQLKQITGKSSAPSVWIKGTYVGGCNDGTLPWHGVRPMLANGKFREMLG